MKVRPIAAVVAASLALGGCSAAFVKAPPSSPAGDADCTTSQALPLLDFGGAFVLGEIAIGLGESRSNGPAATGDLTIAALAAGAVGAVVSGVVGMRRTADCRRLKESIELKRAMRPFEAPRVRAPGADPWLAAGPPPEGFPPPPAPPDGGADGGEVGP